MSRRLPIGIQDFRTMREQRFRYVDKTPFIRNLVENGRFYFLSRPRRFGKSLLLDTLKSLFKCKEELFRGLAIHGHLDTWTGRTPIRLCGSASAESTMSRVRLREISSSN